MTAADYGLSWDATVTLDDLTNRAEQALSWLRSMRMATNATDVWPLVCGDELKDTDAVIRALVAEVQRLTPKVEVFTHCTGCDIHCWSVPGSKCACGGTRIISPSSRR